MVSKKTFQYLVVFHFISKGNQWELSKTEAQLVRIVFVLLYYDYLMLIALSHPVNYLSSYKYTNLPITGYR